MSCTIYNRVGGDCFGSYFDSLEKTLHSNLLRFSKTVKKVKKRLLKG
jgi:hypothetical protein